MYGGAAMRVTVDLLPTTLAFPLVTQRGVGGDGDIMSTHLAANVRFGKPSCMHAYMHADRMTILYSICTNMCVDDTQGPCPALRQRLAYQRILEGGKIIHLSTMATIAN